MTEKPQSELIVEILDQAQTWGRSEYIQSAKSQGRSVHILSLGDAIPPKDNVDKTWLDIKEISDDVSEKLRQAYPHFLHETVKSTGLLDITVLDNKVSLYWLMPISEMSILRNPLIDKVYALFVLREVLKNSNYQQALIVLDDALLEQPIRELCANAQTQVIDVKILKQDKLNYYKNNFALITSWWSQFFSSLAYWLIFNVFNIGTLKKETTFSVLGLTIFPTLWAKNNQDILENLAFGDFPAELKKHGKDVNYLAVPTMKPRNLLKSIKYWQKTSHENHIFFSHAILSFRQILSIYLRTQWGKRLSAWFKQYKESKIYIDSIDISKLVIRELQHEFWSQGLSQAFILLYASEKITFQIKNITSAICAFEFQPIEKAFVAGVKIINPNIKMIGLQTSLLGKSHLGYCFLPEQIIPTNQITPPYAPLPDYVAVYGKTTHAMLSKNLGTKRIYLTGPIRYPYLKINSQAQRTLAEEDWKTRLNLNGETVFALLALPSLKEEALLIMEWAFAIAEKYPQLYFLVRFHYWAVLEDALKKIAQAHSFNRYQIANTDLHELLLASRFIITGTSSVGIEAMVSGCMPVSYKPTRRYDFGRIQDVESGAFLYTNQTELSMAIQECVYQSKIFVEKKQHWQENLEKLCTPLDGRSSQRFYKFLQEKSVLQ